MAFCILLVSALGAQRRPVPQSKPPTPGTPGPTLAPPAPTPRKPGEAMPLSELRPRLHIISQIIQAGRLDEAEKALEQLRIQAGPQPLLDGMEAFLLYRRHQYERAGEMLRLALETPAPPTWWRVLRAMCLYAGDHEAEGQVALDKVRNEDSGGFPEALTSMANAAYLDLRQTPSPDGAVTLAFLFRALGNRRNALLGLNDVAKQFPKNGRLQAARLSLMAEIGDPEVAIKEAEAVLKDNGDSAALHRILGALLRRKKDYTQASIHFQKALELDPKDAPARLAWAAMLQEQGQSGEAQKHLEILAAFPDSEVSSTAFAALGALHTDAKRWKEAEAVLEKGLAAVPDRIDLLNNLAWLYATSEAPEFRNPKRALELAEKANQLSQEHNPNVLDTLAESYFASGDVAKAIEAVRKALALAPGRADFQERLAKYEKAKK